MNIKREIIKKLCIVLTKVKDNDFKFTYKIKYDKNFNLFYIRIKGVKDYRRATFSKIFKNLLTYEGLILNIYLDFV